MKKYIVIKHTMKTKPTIIALLGALTLVAGGCAGSYTAPQPQTTQPGTTTNTQQPATTTDTTSVSGSASVQAPLVLPQLKFATASIANFAFSPSVITVKKNTKVTWTNNDSVPHTVTSDSGTLLSSTTLNTGDTYSFTFTQTGTYSYHCTIHPMMKGTVVVTE